jgi:alginate O-acetyltransferase complex protein AlgI
MSVISFQFVLSALAMAGIFFHLPGTVARRFALCVCNGIFLCWVLPNGASWLAMGTFVLSGYVMARLLRAKPSARILGVYLALLVAAFMVLKKYVMLEPLLPAAVWTYPIVVTGLSYVLFRQIHFLVDVLQQQIEHFTFWSYLNYQANLFGFLSGPIQRYQEFEATWKNWTPLLNTQAEVLLAFFRLFVGICKVGLSAWIFDLFDRERIYFTRAVAPIHFGPVHVLAKFLILFYSYPIYLYLNFSGYCDVVIAAAILIGIRMPENFDRPYLSRNIIDFWTRFHRTLGFWIRDYLFTPLYKAAATRWNERAAALVYPCYFVAFLLAGIWHGSTTNFVVFGVLHGCGASGAKLWESAVVRRTGRKGLKQYLASRPVRIIAIVLTLNFVCLTMLFFPHDLGTTRTILSTFFRRLRG